MCEEDTILKFDVVETDEGGRATTILRPRGVAPEPRDRQFASERPQWSRDT